MKYLSCTRSRSLALQFDDMRRQALARLWESAPRARPPAARRRSRATAAATPEGVREDDLRLAQIEDDRQYLMAIEQARGRLADGRYGVCVDCCERISAARLRAHPIAIRCAACQAAFDARPR